MTNKDSFISVPCPACGSKKIGYVFSKSEQKYEVCLKYEAVFINSRPTPEQLSKHYKKSEYYKFWNDTIFPQSKYIRCEKLFRPHVERIIETCNRVKDN